MCRGTAQNHNKGDPSKQKKIVVVGSLNYDTFLKMKEMPLIDETIAAKDELLKSFGGKGANQCIACARLF